MEQIDVGEPGDPDAALIEQLRSGDAAAFRRVVTEYSPVMLHVARGFVATRASAEEVVQETWVAVIRSLPGFEQRSSLRTWVVRITANIARRRGRQEARTVPWSTVVGPDTTGAVDVSRFRGPYERYPGGWLPGAEPIGWGPEDVALAGEVMVLKRALAGLPERQRLVVTLRDIDGLSSDEVSAALGITTGNVRILLHRGRSRLRNSLDADYRRVSA